MTHNADQRRDEIIGATGWFVFWFAFACLLWVIAVKKGWFE